jgi:hypothetical protein
MVLCQTNDNRTVCTIIRSRSGPRCFEMATEAGAGNKLIANERKCSLVFERTSDVLPCGQCGRQFTSVKYLDMHRTAMHACADVFALVSVPAQRLPQSKTRNETDRHRIRGIRHRRKSSVAADADFRSENPALFQIKMDCIDVNVEMKRPELKAAVDDESISGGDVDQQDHMTSVEPNFIRTGIEHQTPTSGLPGSPIISGRATSNECIVNKNSTSSSVHLPQRSTTVTTSTGGLCCNVSNF